MEKQHGLSFVPQRPKNKPRRHVFEHPCVILSVGKDPPLSSFEQMTWIGSGTFFPNTLCKVTLAKTFSPQVFNFLQSRASLVVLQQESALLPPPFPPRGNRTSSASKKDGL